jgi:hypothetical protein
MASGGAALMVEMVRRRASLGAGGIRRMPTVQVVALVWPANHSNIALALINLFSSVASRKITQVHVP